MSRVAGGTLQQCCIRPAELKGMLWQAPAAMEAMRTTNTTVASVSSHLPGAALQILLFLRLASMLSAWSPAEVDYHIDSTRIDTRTQVKTPMKGRRRGKRGSGAKFTRGSGGGLFQASGRSGGQGGPCPLVARGYNRPEPPHDSGIWQPGAPDPAGRWEGNQQKNSFGLRCAFYGNALNL